MVDGGIAIDGSPEALAVRQPPSISTAAQMDVTYSSSMKHDLAAKLSALAEARPNSVARRVAAAYHIDAEWRGSHPLNERRGADAVTDVWQRLIAAIPDLERRDEILIGGTFEGCDLVAAMGHLCGTFARDWLGIPASGHAVFLRYGEVHRVVGGRIAQSTVLFDLLDLMRQVGVAPIAAAVAREGRWPGPIGGGGVRLLPDDPAEGAASLEQALAMQRALGLYNDQAHDGRDGLLAAPDKPYWHDRMMWYGPSGIGTCRGVAGYVDGHQLPFRLAFPERAGMNHYVRIGDGAFSATGGWPSVRARHGGSFLGVAPTGIEIRMRVMDFYHHQDGLIRENWVPIDVIDILRQMGVDVFARMGALLASPSPSGEGLRRTHPIAS